MNVSNFKLHFGNPLIILEGNKTYMRIKVIIKCNKIDFRCKMFEKSITLHKNDKYDLNKAKNILQACLEQKAYLWAKKIIDREIEKEQNILNSMTTFSEKATHIIEHDADYINNLMK